MSVHGSMHVSFYYTQPPMWHYSVFLIKELWPRTAKLTPSISLKKEWLSMSKILIIQQIDHCWFHVSKYEVIFWLVPELWRHKNKLFFPISETPQPPIQFLFLTTFRAAKDNSLYIKRFWIKGWKFRNIAVQIRCSKMPIFD